jgi:hypothetical protein
MRDEVVASEGTVVVTEYPVGCLNARSKKVLPEGGVSQGSVLHHKYIEAPAETVAHS